MYCLIKLNHSEHKDINMKNKLPTTKSKPVPVKIVNEVSDSPPKADNKWRAEDGLRTLQRAAEVKADKGLMREIKNLAKQQLKAVSK